VQLRKARRQKRSRTSTLDVPRGLRFRRVPSAAMDAFDLETNQYLTWMGVHNYALTTIENRRRYLGCFGNFARDAGLTQPADVTYEIVVDYQAALHGYRKVDGTPLSVATQVQRLVPVTQFFTWMRREHRISVNPTSDLLMPPSRSPTTRGHPQQCRDGPALGRPRRDDTARTAKPRCLGGVLLKRPEAKQAHCSLNRQPWSHSDPFMR
jgi:hypothetical protein